ncbi:MAG: anthranilate synthase component I family protein [Caulobacteraceae bacterium]|nr:anthranilate synthase component I family protein [Caulobacteraceae bacterium]
MTLPCVALRFLPWRDPLDAFAPFAEEDFALLLLSGGGPAARWSYLARDPAITERIDPEDADQGFQVLRRLLGSRAGCAEGGPPLQGGIVGLIAYEYADRLEAFGLPRDPDWPDLILARYDAVLAFDHHARTLQAIGRGGDLREAARAVDRAAAWLDAVRAPNRAPPYPLASAFETETAGEVYEAAVRGVKAKIAAGEIFQANIARCWSGRLARGAAPFDVMRRLQAQSPAPFGAYWRLPGLAIVSHSPERFVAIATDGRAVETRPIKGTRPRGADPIEDARLKAELLASGKDRAENLMIVDLMRNDLSRACAPGTVKAPELFAVESYAAVHHLVSTVTGALRDGMGAADLLAATFPPGSITGAPKVQAMKVIAGLEGPRGPWCGALFWAGRDGAFDSSVLIRTAAFVRDDQGWRFRALAGAGIVADSDPLAERLETEAKILGLRQALTEAP